MVHKAMLALCLGVAAFPAAGTEMAQAESPIVDAHRAGAVGERFDGYLGFASRPSESLRRQVSAINIRRRALYTDLAAKRGVPPRTVAFAAGCVLLSRLSPGGAYMLSDGIWRRRQAGEPPPRPAHCGTR